MPGQPLVAIGSLSRAMSSLIRPRIFFGSASRPSSTSISLEDFLQLVFDLLALEGSQAGEPHVEDGLGLDLAELVLADQVVARRSRSSATRGSWR